jgi:hypothetical protein
MVQYKWSEFQGSVYLQRWSPIKLGSQLRLCIKLSTVYCKTLRHIELASTVKFHYHCTCHVPKPSTSTLPFMIQVDLGFLIFTEFIRMPLPVAQGTPAMKDCGINA